MRHFLLYKNRINNKLSSNLFICSLDPFPTQWYKIYNMNSKNIHLLIINFLKTLSYYLLNYAKQQNRQNLISWLHAPLGKWSKTIYYSKLPIISGCIIRFAVTKVILTKIQNMEVPTQVTANNYDSLLSKPLTQESIIMQALLRLPIMIHVPNFF